ncbi:uncharacterized protein CIMG_12631 [Coccidioides immitis RS]|uniref:Uncharacterized protein n=1 Tax=Coccidioides immitis (strain RS) TaxID=246410 RepID=A0A0D8JRN5_COCIM|nr:uncharacterized protein CIMG_12631 [Coccidioides immitis RS]KJF59952.1 hypothetical protein CIMG_12631 [Coccidioides immitis RS]
MTQNLFDDLKDKLAIQLNKLSEDVENQKDNKKQNNTIINLLNKIKNISDPEQPLQHADLSENETVIEITEDNLKISDSSHKSLQDFTFSVRVLTPDTLLIIEWEHINLDNLLLTDLGSLPSSDKTDNNNKKNKAPEDGTENSNKEIKKSDTSN